MAKTGKNLDEAFAGESQASRRYLYFAEKAESEGLPQIAKLFRAASESETVHARNHLKAMGGIGTTKDNLKAAAEGESYEFTKMYPGFIEQAKAEGNKKAEITFDYANKVEKIHHGLYKKALELLEAGKEAKAGPYYICPVCGYTVAGEAPEKCPVCGAPGIKFKKVD
jgi:rubrerythrin